MNEALFAMFLFGWFGFWVWLRFARPEAFRSAHDAMQGAIDKAAGAAADAVHREVGRKKRPPPRQGDVP